MSCNGGSCQGGSPLKNWEDVIISSGHTVLETLQVIEKSSLQVALVVDERGRLRGIVTDGDIRRALLKGLSLGDEVSACMNLSPLTAEVGCSPRKLLSVMREHTVHHLPLLDDDGVLQGLASMDEILLAMQRLNPVVLMAGGLGKRLGELTRECPKPLLKVGDKPILEIILESFIDAGFSIFYLSVNYKAEMVEQYFGDGSRWGVSIEYIRETRRLGTAGALSLFPSVSDLPLVVMNGDILTRLDFSRLLDFHDSHSGSATMCVREYQMEVPYGVIETEGSRILDIREKPAVDFMVSGGIYVLDPEVLTLIPQGEPMDMPDLFHEMVCRGQNPQVFPLHEYWIDIGRFSDYERANQDFA